MASSTTMPMARTMPSIVNTLIENPAAYMMKKEPISEMGMAITGMTVVRQSRKNKKMINTTSAKAVITVSATSLMDLRMYLVLSKPMLSLMSGGRSRCICSMRR
ncbi:MAG: hypothetical protein BWY83_00754 [bacterium ADurb.Bin478]|nr:MAG: hypothetical protein BWY83_00754 [bacterium ADurb.Bin478]